MTVAIANACNPMETAGQIIKLVEAALLRDDEDSAIAALRRVGKRAASAEESRKLAMLARSIDRNDLALAALEAGPGSPRVALQALHLRTEAGEGVADELAGLIGPEPHASPQLLQLVGALDVEGRIGEAIALIDQATRTRPDWLEGHQALAQLRFQAGEPDPARSFGEALARAPGQELLWAAWMGTIARTSDWSLFDRVSADARKRFPASQLIAMVCADGFSEMGREDESDRLFSQLAAVADPHFDSARMRHAMRYSRFDQAIATGEQAVSSHGAGECWGWLGAAWRFTGDARSDWFHRGGDLIASTDLDYRPSELRALAGLLRQLHRSAGPPLGQSPRGGTQTPGPLLKRRETEIRRFRRKLRLAVRRYIDQLPPPDPRHPFLGRPRGSFRFEGAWSIRLRPGGRHVPHIHSHGWISSAFYVDLPEGMEHSPRRQGWLQFGVPPLPEQGPAPEPLRTIAPQKARLALFPSTFWHGTLPFDRGERLTAAFDVVPR